MNPLALELNAVLEGTVAERLMSPLGKRLYFPRGIIAQSTEAKQSAHAANATIGTAYRGGKPLILSAVQDSMPGLTPEEAVAYAPTAGVEQLRRCWKKLMARKNASLDIDRVSLPVVTPGLTAGLSLVGDLFLPEGEIMLSSDPCWDNYSLIFEERRNGVLDGIPFFGGGGPGLDLAAIEKAVAEEAGSGAVRMIVNFPNNPSGYSPTKAEAQALAGFFLDAAERGVPVLVICDDAYFGHFYEENIYPESLFSLLANLHENILAVKMDGPIKEYYVWGLRTGFITCGSKGLNEAHYNALTTKFMGAIRSSVSCSNTPAQYIVMKALEDERTPGEKARFEATLSRRYSLIKEFLSKKDHPALTPLPFNSGYFMSFRCNGISAEKLRQELLARHGIGVVALGETCLRIAFSSLDEEKILHVYQTIYDTARELYQG